MSIRFDNESDSLKRIISSPGSGTDPFTVLVWVKLVSNVSNYATLIDVGDTYPESAVLRTGANGLDLNIFSSGMNVSGSDPLVVGVWAYIGLVRDAGSYIIYKDAVDIGDQADFGPVTGTTIQFGNNPFGEFSDVEMRGARAWTKALTPEQIALEMTSQTAVEMDGLFGDWDMEDDDTAGEDRSGNNNDLIAVGITAGSSDPEIYGEEEMATYYVNINRTYTATGDGSEGNQFNMAQFNAIRPGTPGDTFLLQGFREYISALDAAFVSGDYAYSLAFDADVTIDAQNMSALPVFSYPVATDDKKFNTSGNIKNIIIDWANNINHSSRFLDGVYSRSRLLGAEGITLSGTKIEGLDCVFIADPAFNLAMYLQAATPDDILEDCKLYGGLSYYVSDETSALEFKTCLFSVANEAAIEDYVEEFEGLPATFTSPTFGWNPSSILPEDLGFLGAPNDAEEPPEEGIPVIKSPIDQLPVIGVRLGKYISGSNGGYRLDPEAPNQGSPGYIPELPPFVETIRPTVEGPNHGFKGV